MHIKLGEEKWYSIVISIANFKFDVEYNYEDINDSRFNSYERHIIFRYKYLGFPITRKECKKHNKIIQQM